MSDILFGQATGLDEHCKSLSTEIEYSMFLVAQPKGSQICLPWLLSSSFSVVVFAQGVN